MARLRAHIAGGPVVHFYPGPRHLLGGMLVVIGGPGAIPGDPEQVEGLMPRVVLALMAGPSVTGLLLTGLLSGRTGLRELGSRLLRWRVDARCYAFALLTAPLSTMAILFALSRISPGLFPRSSTTGGEASLVLLGLGTVLFGGLLEEVGWTGFAVPRLLPRHGVLLTGILVGVLWGAWHFLINAWYSGRISGGVSLAVFVPLYFLAGVAQLTAYRVLMVWVYERTGSLLVVTLMHGSLIASTTPVLLPPTTGMAFLTWFSASAAVFWAVVAVVVVADRGQLARPERNV